MSVTTTPVPTPTPEQDKYSINGLHYTKASLFVLFAWLLWGDFCFTLMESLKPKLLPLFMMGDAYNINASMTVTNLMMLVIPGVSGLLIGPAVSFKSDRYRGPRGRRIPFITWTMPFLTVGLIGMGCGPWFHDFFQATGGLWGLSPTNATILLVGIFVVMFHFFDEFVNSVFWYLFADVVPEAFIGRFLAMFRIVGMGAGFVFNVFIFPHAETHLQWIFIGAGLLYFFGFGLMCWRVKEGEYPPPEDIGENPSIIKQIKVYVSECFGHSVYIYMFLFQAGLAFAMAANAAAVIFHRDGIGLSLESIGYVTGVFMILNMLIAYPCGSAVDRWHPMRVTLLMMIPLILSQLFAFFFLRDLTTFVVLEGLKLVFFALYSAAHMPMLIRIFPKDKYGQFASCNGMIKSTSMMIGGFFAGLFMDQMTDFSADKFAFRWMYVWTAIFQTIGTLALLRMYFIWKKMGGDSGYVPPGSALEKELRGQGAARSAFPVAERGADDQGETESTPA